MNWVVDGLMVLHAACVQSDRYPGIPVTLDEIMSEMTPPSAEHAQREEALVALFKQGGATDADIQLLPLGESVQPHLKAARERSQARLVEAGASPAEITGTLAELDRRHQQLGRNVVVVLPGRTDRVIGFAAHLDAAHGSAGVIDDWAGCVLLANLYQTLRTTRPQHTLWFVGFAEEELGCLGSSAWADALPPKIAGRIDAFVTLDCAGVAAPMAWWSGSHAAMVEIASDAAQRAGVPLQVVDFPGTASDSLSLKRRSIPVLSLFGIDPPRLRLLHGPEDRVEALDRTMIAQSYTLLRALAYDFDAHAQPLLWDYVKAKLRLGDPASGRKPIRPSKLDLTAAPLPAPPTSTTPPPTTAPSAEPTPRDGSRP